jgi:Family of unknown function (DUF6812)
VDPDSLRTERIVIETNRHRIVGDITLPSEGMHSRVSDLLNREGLRFVPLVNALISDLDGGEQRRRAFIAVARDHVQLAYEADDPASSD